jgi:hypothetical protein
MFHTLRRQLPIALAGLMLSAAASAQFLARDIDGNGTTDAYYDSQQNISWLADANYYLTLGGPPDLDPQSVTPGALLPPGELQYSTALSWVDNLVVAGAGDWRLPERLIPVGSPDDPCPPQTCGQMRRWPSELSLLSMALGGTSGPFSNVQDGLYFTFNSELSWLELRNVFTGQSITTNESGLATGFAWAVHDGDVGQIGSPVSPNPEPSTMALMVAGLAGLTVAAKRRRASKPRD